MACINGGRVWDVACVQVLWASGRREKEKLAGKVFKNLILPCLCICRGEEAAQCRSKRHRAGLFFFFRKGKQNLGVTQNWVMTEGISEVEEVLCNTPSH
jgi:hypothetical protein